MLPRRPCVAPRSKSTASAALRSRRPDDFLLGSSSTEAGTSELLEATGAIPRASTGSREAFTYTGRPRRCVAAVDTTAVRPMRVLLRRTRIEDVWEIASRGDVIPQKTPPASIRVTSGLLSSVYRRSPVPRFRRGTSVACSRAVDCSRAASRVVLGTASAARHDGDPTRQRDDVIVARTSATRRLDRLWKGLPARQGETVRRDRSDRLLASCQGKAVIPFFRRLDRGRRQERMGDVHFRLRSTTFWSGEEWIARAAKASTLNVSLSSSGQYTIRESSLAATLIRPGSPGPLRRSRISPTVSESWARSRCPTRRGPSLLLALPSSRGRGRTRSAAP